MTRTEKYEVAVRIAPSQGGALVKIQVDAVSSADAIAVASIDLDAKGKTHWSLEHVAKVTS